MRMLLPPKRLRQEIVDGLRDFFSERDSDDFRTALGKWAAFNHVKPPPVRWRRHLIRRWGAEGLTWPDGTIDLIHPRNWKASETQWLEAVTHELGHYLFWADCERKADLYAKRMLEAE